MSKKKNNIIEASSITQGDMAIDKAVSKVRSMLVMTQAELANYLEVSVMTVSRWERGVMQPSAGNGRILRLALAYLLRSQ